MERLTPRSAILLVGALVLLIGLVGWFAFVSPQRAEAESLEQEIVAMEVRLDLAGRVVRGDRPEERTVQLRRLAVAMPDQVGMPQILRQFSDAANAARVRIEGVTPAVPVPAAGSQPVPITLTVDGHYFGIADFLQALRTLAEANGEEVRASGRLYSVDSISFGASAGAGRDLGRIAATIAMNAFVYSAGAATAPVPTTETADTTGSAAGTNG